MGCTILDSFENDGWLFQAVRYDFDERSSYCVHFDFADNGKRSEYSYESFHDRDDEGEFMAYWENLKSQKSMEKWMRENKFNVYASKKYGYYSVSEEELKIPPESDLGKSLAPWLNLGFKFEWHKADIGGDPYEYHNWTDANLCIMSAPGGSEIGAVNPWELDTALRIHKALEGKN